MGQFASVDDHTAHFGASVQLRKNFAWVQKPAIIKGTFEAQLLIKINARKHEVKMARTFGY